MALHFRCPGCHLRMTAAPQILIDRGRWKSGAAYAGMVAPADDTRAFPCRCCQAPIERGKLVRGVYDERIPLWVTPAAIVMGAAVAYLTGWPLRWGAVAGAVVGIAALLFAWHSFFTLHHDLVENRKLAQRNPATRPFMLGRAFVRAAALAAALLAGTWLHERFGWIVAVIGVGLIFLGAAIAVSSATEPRRKRVSYAEIAEENRRQVEGR